MLLVPICAIQTWNRCEVWKNSETLWNDTIGKYPHRVGDAYNLRGHYYHHAPGRLDAALADFNEALSLNKRNGHAWNNKGALLSQMGHDDSALVCFDRAVAAKPDLPDAFNNRGAVKGRLGDLNGAVSDFTRSIAIDPRFRDPYVNRSVAHFMLRQYDSAVADSRKAITLDAGNSETPSIYDAIGTILQTMNRPGEAVGEHTRAIQSAPIGDPRLGGFHLNRSFAYLASGDRENALQDAIAAQRQGVPVSPEHWKKLGVELKP
jgi:Flp pilus assembly protein TadD